MRKLRVAIVAPSIDLPGGQAVQAERLISAWRGDPDVDARLIPIRWALPRFIRAARRVRFVRTAIAEVCYAPRLLPALARADVVHIFAAPYTAFLLAPLPALIAARALGRPAVLHYHNGEAPDHLQRSRLALAALRRADRLVVPSRYLVDVFARFGLDAQPVANIIDPERFRFRERDPLGARILSTRNLHDLYNVACTIRAFALVKDRRPDASLTIAGWGPNRSALQKLVAQLKLRDVRFAGQIDHAAITHVYARHDIYVQSPNVDNVPNSIVEAMASGLPVVSTSVGGVPTMLRHAEDALLAPIDDHVMLAGHVLRLLDDPPLARRLALAAHEVVLRTYSWSRVRGEWLRLYSEVAAQPARRGAWSAAGPAV
jgi:L-malate glycosyltransferase